DSPYSGAPRQPGAAVAGMTTAPDGGMAPAGGCSTAVDTGCGGCGGGCGDLGGIHFYVGGGAGWIQPNFRADPGFHVGIGQLATVTVNGTPFSQAFPNVDRDLNFAYDFEIAPRAWIGFTSGSGCGFRLSGWEIDTDVTKTIDLSRTFAGELVAGGDTL